MCMRFISTKLVLLVGLVASSLAFGQQKFNPVTQVNWPEVTGSGVPTASCTSLNFGQPYTDISTDKQYVCTPSGWVLIGGPGTGTTIQHDSANVPTQSLLNFLDSPATLSGGSLDSGYQAVKFENDSIGGWAAEVPASLLQFQMQTIPPIAGQFAIVYAGTVTPSTSGTVATATGGLSSGYVAAGGGPTNPGSASLTWSNFALPSYIVAANVTAIYAVATYSGFTGAGGSIPNFVCGTTPFINPPPAGPIRQVNALTGASGSTIGTVSCTAAAGYSGDYGSHDWLNISQIELLVYYTGTAPPSNANINVAPPLYFNPSTAILGLQIPFDYGTDSGSVNAYATTLPGFPALPGIQTGTMVRFLPSASNTSSTPTLNLNATGAITITGPTGSALSTSPPDLSSSHVATVIMDSAGTWSLQNPQSSGSGGVSSVSNSDGTLTISPTTGAVGASLNPAHANTWTATQTFTASLGFDASSAAQIKLPVAPGYTAAAQGEIGHDSTAHNWHAYDNSADSILAVVPSSTGITNGDCANWVKSGSTIMLGDAGAACGSGGSGTVNSGTSGQIAYYSGTGTAVSGTNALPNGTTATTQATQDNSTKVATTAYIDLHVVGSAIDSTTPITLPAGAPARFQFNENPTAATAVTYNLPTAAAGKQFCFTNGYGSGGPNTGTLTLQTSATGQYIIFTDGTLSASDGYVISGGAAADAACVVGVDSTHWMLYVQRGTWTKH